MANRNPYKDVELTKWLLDALESGDNAKVIKHIQFLTHQRNRYEKAYHREYYRRKKLETGKGV